MEVLYVAAGQDVGPAIQLVMYRDGKSGQIHVISPEDLFFDGSRAGVHQGWSDRRLGKLRCLQSQGKAAFGNGQSQSEGDILAGSEQIGDQRVSARAAFHIE